MKTREFKKELEKHGVQFVECKRHTKPTLKGKVSFLPRHSEISNQFANVIKKQLGI